MSNKNLPRQLERDPLDPRQGERGFLGERGTIVGARHPDLVVLWLQTMEELRGAGDRDPRPTQRSSQVLRLR